MWDSKKNYEYFKLTKDNRLLMGTGGIVVHKKYRKTDPHYPHIKIIRKFIKKLFPYLNLDLEYCWTGNFGFTEFFTPLIQKRGNIYSISGAADQVLCNMAAKHIALKIMNKPSSLDGFFPFR